MSKDTIVYLSMMTWKDIASACAEHVYGTLQGNVTLTEKEVYRILTESEAAEINKKENIRADAMGLGHHGFAWKEGSKYKGFYTETEVIEQAKKVWKELFPDAKILILGTNYVCSPQEILDGDMESQIIKDINALVKEYNDPTKKGKALFMEAYNTLMKKLETTFSEKETK